MCLLLYFSEEKFSSSALLHRSPAGLAMAVGSSPSAAVAPSSGNGLQDDHFPSSDAHIPLLSASSDEDCHVYASAFDASPPAYTDWLGRPITGNSSLGGWKCSACLICAYGLGTISTTGIIANLVVFLVQEWGWDNATGATTVNTLSGTIYLSAFLTGSLVDAYMGRAWTSIIFQSLITMCLMSATCILWVSSTASSTSALRTAFMAMLYTFSIMTGPILLSIVTFGADQLVSGVQKEMYFKLVSIANTLGTLLVTVVVTYMDDAGMWIAGYWVCTASAGGAAALIWIVAPQCQTYKVLRNPLVQIAQVLVAAWRQRSLPHLDKEASLLNGCYDGSEASPVPWNGRISRTSMLSFLDKAAVPSSADACKLNEPNPWHKCTVQQVEELKCLLRLIPIGIPFMFLTAMSGQVTSLFEEQALVMDRQVTSWLILPPASLNVFSICGSLFVGFLNAFGGAQWIGWLMGCCRWRGHQNPSPLQMQGLGVVLCIFAMVTAALVESRRLNAVGQDGTTLSILWLVPQTIMVGASMHINLASSFEFFYREASDDMRMTSNCILYLFHGFGNYLNSIMVAIVTAITTRGGHEGWIPSDLNKGHLDYFYWFFASMLVGTLCIHLAYASYYTRTKKLHTIHVTLN